MSLATRCNACGTMFRVVQDQLRVSEGWVRCGRCDTVFNALDALVDLEAEEAATAAADPSPSDGSFYGSADAPQDETEDGPHRRSQAGPDPAALPDRPEPGERSAPPLREPEWVPEQPPRAPWDDPAPHRRGDAPDDEPLLAPALAAPVWRATREDSSAGEPAPVVAPWPAPGATASAAPAPTPAFMRQAERDARWTSPAMRAALIGTALMLGGLLAVQAVYHFRDTVAASSPAADSLLRSACARWGCRIEAPRRIDQVTLEGSGLSRVPQQPEAVKLAINLRNRGHSDLMMPSVDLSLTDAKGDLIARRVLGPADFRVEPARIGRGAELPLELVLSTGDRAIAGYTVELFYP